MTGAAVQVRGLVVRRGGAVVLDHLDLDLPPGRTTGVVGPGGCGKTTLLRVLVGVQRVESGEAVVLGEPAGSPVLRSRVGYSTQAASLYDELTVEQNLQHARRLLGADHAQVRELLEVTGLVPQARQRVGSLSGGQRHRASLAVALLGRPELLVLDEPTVGLDPELRRDLWALFGRLRDDGASLVVSSHVMDEALRCDELLLLRDGRLLAQGPPDRVLGAAGARDPDEAFLELVAADRAGRAGRSERREAVR